MALHIVVAISSNRVIGKEGGIPWHLPEDLRMFKELTLNHPVLMGRKTFFSIISQLGKPLPQRHNLVLTKDKKVKMISIETTLKLRYSVVLKKLLRGQRKKVSRKFSL